MIRANVANIAQKMGCVFANLLASRAGTGSFYPHAAGFWRFYSTEERHLLPCLRAAARPLK